MHEDALTSYRGEGALPPKWSIFGQIAQGRASEPAARGPRGPGSSLQSQKLGPVSTGSRSRTPRVRPRHSLFQPECWGQGGGRRGAGTAQAGREHGAQPCCVTGVTPPCPGFRGRGKATLLTPTRAPSPLPRAPVHIHTHTHVHTHLRAARRPPHTDLSCVASFQNVTEKQKACETDLAKAEPALLAAQEALDTLNKVRTRKERNGTAHGRGRGGGERCGVRARGRSFPRSPGGLGVRHAGLHPLSAAACCFQNNLTELKSFGSPPDAVVNVTAAVMILTAPGGKIPKDKSWKAAKIMMGKVDTFLDSLKKFDKEHIPEACLKAFK